MGKRRLLLLLILLVSVISVYGITGYVTLDVPKDLNITLNRIEYQGSEDLDGSFIFNLRSPLKENTKVKLTLGNVSKEVFLKDLFNEQSISFEVVSQTLTGKNPSNTRRLFFNEAGTQSIFVKLPKGANVNKADMKIKGEDLNGSFPREVSMDIGSDNNLEFLFLGDFVGFVGDLISTANFSVQPGSSAILDNTGKYLCQTYGFNKYTKDIEMNAHYSLFDASSTNGDINASILSPGGSGDSIKGFGGGDVCNLPEPGTSFSTNKCNLKIPRPIKGNYMLCVYNAVRGTTSKNYYKLGSNGVNSGKAYVCNPPNPVTSVTDCTRVQDTFYIGFRAANYSDVLNKEINVSKGYTDRNFEKAFTDFLAGCSGTDCIVPVDVNSNRGTILFSGLQIIYNKAGLTKEENSFYEVESTESYISKVKETDLTTGNITLEIPLSYFGIKTPVVRNDKQFDVEVKFDPGNSIKKTITVKGITTRKIDILEDVKSDLEEFNIEYKDVIDFLGFSGKLEDVSSKFNEKEKDIEDVEASNLSESEKKAKKDSLIQEIAKLREQLPRRIDLKQDVKDVIIVTPEDVEKSITEDINKDIIYELQKGIKVNVNARLYDVLFYDGTTKKKTLINKNVEGSVDQGYVVEIIPKNIASNANNITFKERPTIIEADPVVRWDYTSLPFDISYMVDNDVLGSLGNVKTIVVPSSLEEKPAVEAVCGNNKCEFIKIGDRTVPLEDEYSCPQDCKGKVPWLWVVIILFVAGVGAGYIYYKKKQPLFKSKVDEENLTRYVQKALEQKYTKQRIDKSLLDKEWSQRQIDYVYAKVLRQKGKK